MKGLFLSAAVFLAYCVSAVVLSHLIRPQRHSGLFIRLAAFWSAVYLGLHLATPRDLGVLPPAWTADPAWLDMAVGLSVLLLNVHSFVDFFFGFNGGFSTSLLLNLLRVHPRPLRTTDLVDRYRSPSGFDKIIGWRLPALVRDGYLRIDTSTDECSLTPRGSRIATVTRILKRILNLEKGG
jgi:hypothetical protein